MRRRGVKETRIHESVHEVNGPAEKEKVGDEIGEGGRRWLRPVLEDGEAEVYMRRRVR